jgi:hypothetical protein
MIAFFVSGEETMKTRSSFRQMAGFHVTRLALGTPVGFLEHHDSHAPTACAAVRAAAP